MTASGRKDIVVYTAITGRLDSLKAPPGPWRAGADFVAFLDYEKESSEWDIRDATKQFVDPCRNAKAHKVLCHQYFSDYSYSIWIDGSVSVVSTLDVSALISTWLKDHDLALFRHRSRQCVYQEAQACFAQNKDEPKIIQEQITHYRGLGYPENAGLNECMVLVRRHTEAVRRFNDAWFAEITRFSRRDQLSFNYVTRQLGLKFHELEGNIARNEHFAWHLHDHDPALHTSTAATP